MNCLTFESAINELARDQMMEAEARRRALAHAGACERCGARLADERALTAGLRKMSESREEAPANVEASLRAAFAESVAARLEPAIPGRPRWLRWCGAAAAILLVALLALTAIRSRPVETPDTQRQASKEKEAPAPITPSPVDRQPDSTPAKVAATGASKPRVVVRRAVGHSAQRSTSRPETNSNGASDSETEIATEFIPLIHGGNVAVPDGGHIMRVELPRSALVSFGLPMNMERADQRVRADVVVGNDGLARAIRFVH